MIYNKYISVDVQPDNDIYMVLQCFKKHVISRLVCHEYHFRRPNASIDNYVAQLEIKVDSVNSRDESKYFPRNIYFLKGLRYITISHKKRFGVRSNVIDCSKFPHLREVHYTFKKGVLPGKNFFIKMKTISLLDNVGDKFKQLKVDLHYYGYLNDSFLLQQFAKMDYIPSIAFYIN